jgi:hypothetical protein
MSSAKTTTNHDEIRKWVETRGGHPAVVAPTESKSKGGTSGLLRIDDRLHRITWSEFFDTFDKNRIAFLYDPDGDSPFSKFVQKESANS